MIIAGIPAYNEEKQIGVTILSVKKYVDKVIVVDDGSSDSTSDISNALGAVTLTHKYNLGYGSAILTLLREAKKLGATVLVIHNAYSESSEIPFLIAPINNGKADLVIKVQKEAQNIGISLINRIKYRKMRKSLIYSGGSFAFSYNLIEKLVDVIDSGKLKIDEIVDSNIRDIGGKIVKVESSFIDYFHNDLDNISKFNSFFYDLTALEKTDKKVISKVEEKKLPFIHLIPQCNPGKKDWKKYENLCRDILKYLFVPPLSEPIEQLSNKNRFQRKDLIFRIPYDAKGFWYHIQSKYSAEALIVECKNNSQSLRSNEIIVTSKYLNKYRLGEFCMVLHRNNLSDSARSEIRRIWEEDHKMILCVSDDDLIKMIDNKEMGIDPEVVIDNIRWKFLQSL